MPWSNQNGGGGPWGGGGDNNNNNNNNGGGGGPWGQGPKGPRGGGQNTPPDLEDILRKGQDRLKRFSQVVVAARAAAIAAYFSSSAQRWWVSGFSNPSIPSSLMNLL